MAPSKPELPPESNSRDPRQEDTEVDESAVVSRLEIPSGTESTVVIDGTDVSQDASLGHVVSEAGDTSGRGDSIDLRALSGGTIIGDFQIRRVLGKGAFGTVYLALQLSLNRHVALKVTGDLGHEGRRMARLEHPNIVQVYAEQIFVDQRIRLLSMQYVAGPTLQTVLRELHESGQDTGWSGSTLLDIVDRHSGTPGTIHPDDYTTRVQLQRMDHQQAVCLIAAELAHGLQFAHAHDVLHRDIKPANVLLNAAGRPLLVDFNLAEDSGDENADGSMMGGTPVYMSPEHLRAFEFAGKAVIPVGPQADIYSLAVVSIQLLTGTLPLPPSESGSETQPGKAMSIIRLKEQRRKPLSVSFENPTASQKSLRAVIERATDPDPKTRTRSARRLSDELTSCRRLRHIETQPVMQRAVLTFAARCPVTVFVVLALVPQIIASVVNITYNKVRVPELTTLTDVGGQHLMSAFDTVTLWYNAVVWPMGIAFGIRMMKRSLSGIQMHPCGTSDEEKVQRRSVIRLPRDLIVIAILGWMPGTLVFPLALWILAAVDPTEAFSHFTLNFATSGLLAVTYSFLGVSWFVISVVWLQHWRFPAQFSRDAVELELGHFRRPLQRARIAAAIVPLLSCILLIMATGPDMPLRQFRLLRVLLVMLIVLGMLGPLLANLIMTNILERLRIYADGRD